MTCVRHALMMMLNLDSCLWDHCALRIVAVDMAMLGMGSLIAICVDGIVLKLKTQNCEETVAMNRAPSLQ